MCVCVHVCTGLKEDADYVDIDQHDEYVDPEELMGGAESSAGDSIPPTSPPASFDLFKPLPSEYIHITTHNTHGLPASVFM